MEKRILLAVSLSFIVLVVYQTFLMPPPPEPMAPVEMVEPVGEASAAPSMPEPRTEAAVEPVAQEGTSQGEPTVTSSAPDDESVPEPVIAEATERTITVETPDILVDFSNRGGVVQSWRLKHYEDSSGQPLELVPGGLEEPVARPFAVRVDDPRVTAELGKALYRATKRGLDGTARAGSLVLEFDNGAGLRARKEFRFEPASQPYMVTATISVTQDGRALTPTVEWGPGLTDQQVESRMTQAAGGLFMLEDSPSRLSPSDIAETPEEDGSFKFAGIDDHYFLSVALPADAIHVAYATVTRPAATADGSPMTFVSYAIEPRTPGSSLSFFVGPKDFDILAAVDGDLVRSIDFGFFAFLCVPLLRSLKWIYGFVGNYGWSIVILTIMINAVMFPLRHKSVVSMRKMQEIQPEVKAIQERYSNLKATDPARQKMNTELMNLYRERGVNPASGCLPMLLTMPVLFAFYSLLSVAIEIRGAPFALWITDLSVHDPLYITPVIMGITMVWQQMKTPSTADPTQQKVMMFMPVMFTFMFLWASSGLVLYWLVSNLWAIGQQAVTNRIIGPPVVKAVRPPAERRVKKAGRSKSKAASRASQSEKS